jgi:uncharacterized membrane protein YkvA (DUF1232 family)
MKKFWVALTGCIAALYLINPTAGVLELIPDNLPVAGNLDEGVACYLLYSCIEYFRGRKIGIFADKE